MTQQLYYMVKNILQGVMPFTGVWSSYYELYLQTNKQTNNKQKSLIVFRSHLWQIDPLIVVEAHEPPHILCQNVNFHNEFNSPVMYKRDCSANLLYVLRLLQSSNSVFLVRLCRSMHILRVQAFFQKPRRISTITDKSNALNGGPLKFQSRKKYFFFANFYQETQENFLTLHRYHKFQSKYGKIKTKKMLCL